MDRVSYLTMMIQAYSPEIESQILNFYNSLSEKDRRRYAAIEATKLGYGGVTYIRSILQCDDRTINQWGHINQWGQTRLKWLHKPMGSDSIEMALFYFKPEML